MLRLREKNDRYSPQYKEHVLKDYEEHGLSIKDLSIKYNVKYSTLCYWIKMNEDGKMNEDIAFNEEKIRIMISELERLQKEVEKFKIMLEKFIKEKNI